VLKVIIEPVEIIDVDDAAAFMRIDFADDEEAVIEGMIAAARQLCEENTRRAIGIQTLELTLDQFPYVGKKAILLRPPLIAVTSFKYLDPNGDEVTMVEGTDFYLGTDSEPAELRPVCAWPAALNQSDSIRIRFTAGYDYGNSPLGSILLPKTIRQAMLMQIADLYNNREAQTEKPLSLNMTVERLLAPYVLEMGI